MTGQLVPLSPTTMHGGLRRLAMAVSSRTTYRPDSEVSAMQAGCSRLPVVTEADRVEAISSLGLHAA